ETPHHPLSIRLIVSPFPFPSPSPSNSIRSPYVSIGSDRFRIACRRSRPLAADRLSVDLDPGILAPRSGFRAFEQHRHLANSQASSDHRSGQSRRKSKSLNPLSHPFCEHSPFAAIDIVMLFLVLGALAVLTVPYFQFIFREAYELLPAAIDVIGDVLYQAPVAYAAGLIFVFVTAIAAWEFFNYQARKCGNPYCKGLRKAVEFDIQLESEECVKCLPPLPKDAFGTRPLDLGQDHKELEAELKKMAPLNGRTVLIFRSPCGCPLGRMEVWGPKKVRRIKK
ncbi:hypothetical protein BHM03_00024081, partial [Ensete ventricosum]